MIFSAETRVGNLARMAREEFDILIIGGGITGAGLALDAASRGLKTALVERRDFGAGTSSRSTKLIHGGLRYLEHFDFAMVREGLLERAILTRIAPHLAEPFPFLVPVYRDRRRNYDHPLKMRAGMILYDLLAGRYRLGRHRRLTREEALRFAPLLDPRGLEGALLYYDGLTNDSRLVIEVVKAAHQVGACVVNHVAVSEFLRDEAGLVRGVRLNDLLAVSGAESGTELRAKVVINATGVWMEETLRLPGGGAGDLRKRVRPSKGIHLTVSAERLPVSGAWLIPSLRGHRFYFVVPWEGRVNIGTTDTDYDGDKGSPRAVRDEVVEILGAINAYFPEARLEESDVITSWAGLRPLVSDPRVTKTTDVSRKEEVIETPDGVISIAGGKLTTYRLMAEQGVDLAIKRLRERGRIGGALPGSPTRRRPVCGGEMTRDELKILAAKIAAEESLPPETASHLVFSYGSETPLLVEMMREDERLRQPLVAGLPHLAVEVVHAARNEMAVTVSDVMTRRTRLAMVAGERSLAGAAEVAAILARELGWTAAETSRQLDDFQCELEAEYTTAQ